MGQLMKCDAVYETPFWREAGLNGFGINDSGAARAVFDNYPADGEPGVLLAFVGGDDLAQLRPAAARPSAARPCSRASPRCSATQALRPIEYVEHDWTQERWTGGGPTAIHAPGTLVAVRPGRSGGRSAACTGPAPRPSTYWSGYMDGAVRSGERAAVEVLEKLR